MEEYFAGKYDVAIVGAGHAGVEAALAAARLGAKTCLFTLNLDKIANMPCNPSIGGTAKGHLVREIDALGGEMGKAADKMMLQSRMLNLGKGPAVHSLRAQEDRALYHLLMKHTVERQENLDLKQAEIVEVRSDGNGGVLGVTTHLGAFYEVHNVVICTGTYLKGIIYVGDRKYESGPDASQPSKPLSKSLESLGIKLRRFKTGTPARIAKNSIDYDKLEIQYGDEHIVPFSFETEEPMSNKVTCWIGYTNEETHEIIRRNIGRSPLYSGKIEGIGPRYCPSIETKLVTFPDKQQHPLFLEPEGEDTNEMYLNGFSSSMPMDIQLKALHEIPALRDAKIYRPGYAIEYDYFDPTQLKHTLESKIIKGLFFAGQVNGTTGYEEAGGQGTVAGINAALHCTGDKTFEMKRDESYIGVLIDDLTTKGVDEPYRMFTSRAEYRILLRQDDADARLTEKAYELGIAKRDRYDWWLEKKEAIERIIDFCANYPIKKEEINPKLEALGTTPLRAGCKLIDLVARPHLNLQNLSEIIPDLKAAMEAPANRKKEIAEAAEIKMKYKGYIDRERLIADKMHRLENIRIKGRFNYSEILEISTEGRQKLERIDPDTLAQASRIPGVSPSDINVLLILLGR